MSEAVEDVMVDLATGEVIEGEPQGEPEPDGEPEGEPEPEPDPQDEPEPGEDEQRRLAIDKALEREHKRHEKSLSALYADEWDDRVMCPLCIGEGFLLPWQAGELPEEQLAAIEALSGRSAAAELVEDTDYVGCDHCDGWGRTITGAKNPEHQTKLCDKCSGNGFVKKPYVVPPLAALPGASDPQPPIQPQPVNYGSTQPPDQWGRPAGHVHYGIEPQFVTA